MFFIGNHQKNMKQNLFYVSSLLFKHKRPIPISEVNNVENWLQDAGSQRWVICQVTCPAFLKQGYHRVHCPMANGSAGFSYWSSHLLDIEEKQVTILFSTGSKMIWTISVSQYNIYSSWTTCSMAQLVFIIGIDQPHRSSIAARILLYSSIKNASKAKQPIHTVSLILYFLRFPVQKHEECLPLLGGGGGKGDKLLYNQRHWDPRDGRN